METVVFTLPANHRPLEILYFLKEETDILNLPSTNANAAFYAYKIISKIIKEFFLTAHYCKLKI